MHSRAGPVRRREHCFGGDEYSAAACRASFEQLAKQHVWQTPTLAFRAEVATIGTPAARIPGCRQVFTICISCDRGQRYCSAACRDAVRRQRRREADRRCQQSDRGREARRCRQRRYRERHAARVTDQGCEPTTAPAPSQRPLIGHCRICGQFRRWIDPCPPIPRRWWTHGPRRPSG